MANKALNELRPYHKNPRKITAEKLQLLKESIVEFGDLSGVVFNETTGQLVGGHQRVQVFKDAQTADIKIEKTFDEPTSTGTVAVGYIEIGQERFSYRKVRWDEKQEERANIAANKMGGFWDYEILANQFSEGVLLASGFDTAELGFTSVLGTGSGDREEDTDKLKDSMESYLGGNVKHISLYFKKEDFDAVLTRVDKLMAETDTHSHTDAFLALLDFYEGHKGN